MKLHWVFLPFATAFVAVTLKIHILRKRERDFYFTELSTQFFFKLQQLNVAKVIDLLWGSYAMDFLSVD